MSATASQPTPQPLPNNPEDIQTPATQQALQQITQQAQDARATPIPQPNQAEMASQPAWGAKQQGMGIADQDQPLVPKGVSPSDPNAYNPSVQRAGVWHTVATALMGGQRYKTTYDANGVATRTPIPVSGKALGLALAMELLGGAARGAGAGVNPGKAAQAGAEYGQQLQQQRRADQQAANTQAQNDFTMQQNQIVRKAATFEVAMRGLLNAATASKYGAEAIDQLVELNKQSGLLDPDANYIENNGVPMTEAELLAGQQSGAISPLSHLGVMAGRVQETNPDGTTRWDPTFLVLKSGDDKTDLSQTDWDRYAQYGVPGYKPGVKIGNNVTIPVRMKASANEQLNAHVLTAYRLRDLRTALEGTPFESQVPAQVDWSVPGTERGMLAYSRYTSHDAENADDPYMALKAMGQAKRNDKTGQLDANPDSKFVDSAAQALGGWPLLEAAHNEILANRKAQSDFAVIDTSDKAEGVLSNPRRFSTQQIDSAKHFIQLVQRLGIGKATAEVRARAIAEGADQEAMYKYGKNPITGEKLSLDNAPDGMLVNGSGEVVPISQQAFYKPSQNERQTADTARQALQISADLRAEIAKNPALVGPLAGRSKQGLAKLGVGDAEAQTLINNVNFLQSAATKVHTGRFSNEILKKMSGMIQPGMNPDQFTGALNSMDAVMGRYAKEDQLVTVGDLKAMQGGQVAQATVRTTSKSTTQTAPRVVPPGATPGRDPKTGAVIGYRLPNGQTVRF